MLTEFSITTSMEYLWAFRSTKENTCHPGISIALFSTMNQRVHIPDPYPLILFCVKQRTASHWYLQPYSKWVQVSYRYTGSTGFLKLSPPKNKMPKLDLHHWTLVMCLQNFFLMYIQGDYVAKDCTILYKIWKVLHTLFNMLMRVPSYLESTSFYSIFWSFSFLSSVRLRAMVFQGSPMSTHMKSDGVFSVAQKLFN